MINMSGQITKILFLFIGLPLLASLSGGSAKYLSGIASTSVMNEYATSVESIREVGKLSASDMDSLKQKEGQYLESLKSSGYSEKKLYLDYFFVPLVISFFAIIWSALGWFLAVYDLKFVVPVFLLTSLLLVALGFSYQPLVHIAFLLFGFYLRRKKQWGAEAA